MEHDIIYVKKRSTVMAQEQHWEFNRLLNIGNEMFIDCTYCSRRVVLKSAAKSHDKEPQLSTLSKTHDNSITRALATTPVKFLLLQKQSSSYKYMEEIPTYPWQVTNKLDTLNPLNKIPVLIHQQRPSIV